MFAVFAEKVNYLTSSTFLDSKELFFQKSVFSVARLCYNQEMQLCSIYFSSM